MDTLTDEEFDAWMDITFRGKVFSEAKTILAGLVVTPIMVDRMVRYTLNLCRDTFGLVQALLIEDVPLTMGQVFLLFGRYPNVVTPGANTNVKTEYLRHILFECGIPFRYRRMILNHPNCTDAMRVEYLLAR